MADGLWGLDRLEGGKVQVTAPGHPYILQRTGTLRLDRNDDGTVRSLELVNSTGRVVVIGWGPGVLVEPVNG